MWQLRKIICGYVSLFRTGCSTTQLWMISNKVMVHEAKNLNGTHPFNPTYTSNSQTELILCSRVLFEKLTVTQLIKQLPAFEGTLKLITLFKQILQQLSHDVFKFKTALKRFLLANSFYTLDKYYSWKQGLWLLVLHFKNIIITLLLFNYLLTSVTYDYT